MILRCPKSARASSGCRWPRSPSSGSRRCRRRRCRLRRLPVREIEDALGQGPPRVRILRLAVRCRSVGTPRLLRRSRL